MIYRIRTLAVVAATLAASLLAAPSAHAEDPDADTRPCVSAREYRSVYQQTKPALEKRWEVEGLGVDVTLEFGIVNKVVVYPRCGFDMAAAWYGITYKKRGDNLWAAWATQCESWKTGASCLVS